MRRIIEAGPQARAKLAEGARKIAEAVGSTLGPFGQNWFLDKKNTITNDGVTIAREFHLEDEIENRGATAIREAAIKTVEQVGDGTTTAIMLAYAIYDRASRLLGDETTSAKMRPTEVVLQMERERREIEEQLSKKARKITTKEEVIDSARVAVEDETLGRMIGEAQWELGPEGYLLAEETAERTSSIERVHGIRIDNGFGTSQVINNPEKECLEVEDTLVLLTSYTIKDVKDWQYIMEVCAQVAKDGKNKLVVIARAWTDETVRFCLENINKGMMRIYPISAPYENMQERFKDLAAVLGGKFYDAESSRLKDVVLSDLGFAAKVTARRFDAVLTGRSDSWTTDRVKARVEELKAALVGTQSDFEKKHLAERIAQLENGFAIVKVGSASDMERRRLFDKCEDAVNAVRAAFQDGTVEGGGLALKLIADSLPDDYLLKYPIMEPYKRIMQSAPPGFVIEDWVRDPLRVVRTALEKACIAAGAFATAGGVITEQKPKPLDEMLRANTPKA